MQFCSIHILNELLLAFHTVQVFQVTERQGLRQDRAGILLSRYTGIKMSTFNNY